MNQGKTGTFSRSTHGIDDLFACNTGEFVHVDLSEYISNELNPHTSFLYVADMTITYCN